MRYIKPPIGTVCVGTAFGEAGMLLAAGEPVRSCFWVQEAPDQI